MEGSILSESQIATAAKKRLAFVRYPKMEADSLPAISVVRSEEEGSPQITIIIPTIGGTRQDLLTRLLAQITQQTFRRYEIVIVRGDRRQGRAINTAAAIARGNILVTMDDDTSLGVDGLLEQIAATFAQDPTIGIVGVSNLTPSGAPLIVQRAMRELPRRSSPLVNVVTESDMAEHGCLAVRRDLFYEMGGEHELVPRGLDPYLRQVVRRLGYRVVVIPGAWIHHLVPSTFKGIVSLYFRNGLCAAYVQRFYPECVIEQAVTHGTDPPQSTRFANRLLRYARHLVGALVLGRWVYLGTLVSYAAGYAWGYLTVRQESL